MGPQNKYSLLLATVILLGSTPTIEAGTIQAGNMFISVATPGEGAVYQIDQNGYASLFASGLDSPNGLAFSSDGQLYVTEVGSGEVTNITAGGDFTGAAAHASGFGYNTIKNLLIDTSGRILLANRSQGTVVDITEGGTAQTLPAFASGLSGTRDVFQTSTGDIYVVEEYSGEVTNITGGGDFTFAQAFAAGFDVPYAMAESGNGELFLVEALTGNVYDITNGNGAISLFASGLGVTDEIIFGPGGVFLAVQEYDGSIIDISSGGSGPYPIIVNGLGIYPQQIAIAPAVVPLPAALWLMMSSLCFVYVSSKSKKPG